MFEKRIQHSVLNKRVAAITNQIPIVSISVVQIQLIRLIEINWIYFSLLSPIFYTSYLRNSKIYFPNNKSYSSLIQIDLFWAILDLNQRPRPYQGRALPTELIALFKTPSNIHLSKLPTLFIQKKNRLNQ